MGKSNTGGKFLIMDGHSLAYRAFFALPLELQTKKGLHTNAALGFTRMLLRLLEDESPDYLLVTFDYPAPTFRHQVYSQYKATRKNSRGNDRADTVYQRNTTSFNIAFVEFGMRPMTLSERLP